jgi:hypothetical protein
MTILVDNAPYLTDVLAAGGYRFRYELGGNRDGIEGVFIDIERRKYSFSNSFRNSEPATAQSWLEASVVYHDSRQG